MTTPERNPNRLIKEKSPYLLQHAHNGVDWFPWGEEAFEKARREDKPIFLSVGYSTCYWCHVMEREVFENDTIADLMNQFVVSIKVDREERPDIDRVYMSALQAMTGSGGWPMSMFLTSDRKPFFGATYIPPTEQYGRPGFAQILERIHHAWTSDRRQITEAGDRMREYLLQLSNPGGEHVTAGTEALEKGFEYFDRTFDPLHGGFGGAPKFPRPVVFNFLFRYYARTKHQRALEISLETLRHMARGGMYDHVGGGFHRYSTDGEWHVPHFEKMLYDQAQLVISYLEAFQLSGDHFFADVARDILEYVLRDLLQPGGAFASAEDAESAPDPSFPGRKEEGAFYVWTRSELRAILSGEEARTIEQFYGVTEAGNVSSDPHGVFTGRNIFHIVSSTERIARESGVAEEVVRSQLASARQKLMISRSGRVRPHLDDKVLTSWNGLMISAFARAYQVFGEERYRVAADTATRFVLSMLRDQSTGELLHRYRDGEAGIEGHLDDYASLIQALIDFYEADFDIHWLTTALSLADHLVDLFYDTAEGGFFDTSGRDTSVIVRTKEWYDGAEPSGNAIAILDLLRLAEFTKSERLGSIARRSLVTFGRQILSSPHAMPQFLVALDFSFAKPLQIILAGKKTDALTDRLLRKVHERFVSNRILILADGASGQDILSRYVPFIGSLRMIKGLTTAYVCADFSCQLPTTDPDILASLIEG